jgi:hypothetical protein
VGEHFPLVINLDAWVNKPSSQEEQQNPAAVESFRQVWDAIYCLAVSSELQTVG